MIKGMLRQVLSLGRVSGAQLRLAKELLLRQDLAPDEVRRHLPDLLASGNWEVRNAALKLVARIRDEERFGLLAEKLLDAREAGIIRRNAAELLLAWGRCTPEVEAALCRALSDLYWEVRAEAARALSGLAPPGGAPERAVLGRLLNGAARSAAGELPGRAIRERNFEVRAGLAEALGALGLSQMAFAALERLAADPQWLVRYQAAIALAHFGSRLPEHRERALAVVRQVDHACSGALPTFVFPRRLRRLIDDMTQRPGTLTADVLRNRYIHLKRGWHRIDEMIW